MLKIILFVSPPQIQRVLLITPSVSVESTGILPPRVLFQEAIKEFVAKIETVEAQLQKIANPNESE